MDTTIVASLIGVIGALIGVWIGGVISKRASIEAVKSSNDNATRIMQRQEFFVAASKFKATVIYEISGFYPGEHWEENEWPRIYQSIPRVNSAAAEFRYFVTSKGEFDTAVNEYNKYCRETTKSEAFNRLHFKSTPGGKASKDYKKEFKNIVDHVLSFANEK